MFTYSQSTGVISQDGNECGVGYSGHPPDGLNNPEMEDVPDIGPIPRGQWRIVKWWDSYENKGPTVAQLSPVGHDAHGRSDFLIHGDNSAGNHSASHGCIIAGPSIRHEWCVSGDLYILVTE